jgi:tellurium resistance protein TerD
MTTIQRGFRGKISQYADPAKDLTIQLSIDGDAVYDTCCFGLDANDKLGDDRYMVFYNQKTSPQKEITQNESGKNSSYTFNLSRLPTSVVKLAFTISVDGEGVMSQIRRLTVSLAEKKGAISSFFSAQEAALSLELTGADFSGEKALIAVEMYRKDEWRLAAVASGFHGGLLALLKHYGGEQIEAPVQPAPQPIPKSPPKPEPTLRQPSKITLSKGQKISLSKNAAPEIVIENGWTAQYKDYDLKALVRYRDGRLVYIGAANADESLASSEGAVRHGGDVRAPGELEKIVVKWHPDIASVAVSSYSALENGAGSFREYGVFVRITNGSQVVEIPARSASAESHSYTLCFGELLFGQEPGAIEATNLEMYSAPGSENRIGYQGSKVVMDLGPVGRTK